MALRYALYVLYIGVIFGLTLVVSGHALAPAWARARPGRLRLAALLLTAFVAALEVAARRLAPLGGGAWLAPVWAERVLLLVLVCVTLSVGVSRVAHRIRHGPAPEPAPQPDALTRREALTRAVAVTTASVATPTFVAGAVHGRHDLRVSDVTVTVPELPASLEGVTIVQLTDLHAGIFTGPRELDRLTELVRDLRGDVVVLTGDILDNNPRLVPDAMRALSRLRARMGVYAVLGNHDHYTGAARVARGLAAVGITPLRNQRVTLGAGGRGAITLAGVDDVMAARIEGDGGGPDLARALRDADPEAPVVLLAHNPVFFHEAAGKVALQLSGHTHGGQIDLGPVTRAALPYVAGRYDARGSALYVSRGVGVTGPPVRLGAAPEVVRIALTARRRGV